MNYYSISYNQIIKYRAIVYATSYVNPIDFIASISKELSTNIISNSFVLFDLLLSNGDNFNRFVEGFFDGNEVRKDSLKIIDISDSDLESINKYYSGRGKELNNSILTQSEKFKYMKSP